MATTLMLITKLFLQADGGFYSIPWDATAGLMILPGAGEGTLTHNGQVYRIMAKDRAATVPFSNPAIYVHGWTELQLDGSKDDIQAALDVAGRGYQLSITGPVRQRFTPPTDPAGTIMVQLPTSELVAFLP